MKCLVAKVVMVAMNVLECPGLHGQDVSAVVDLDSYNGQSPVTIRRATEQLQLPVMGYIPHISSLDSS